MKLWVHSGAPFRLTVKELKRADANWTVVTRPHQRGYVVAAINTKTGLPHLGRGYLVENKRELGYAAQQCMRWLDKMGIGGEAASVARMRPTVKGKRW